MRATKLQELAKQKPPVTRPEAIRGILELGLKAKK
jgi:hypothetical protein